MRVKKADGTFVEIGGAGRPDIHLGRSRRRAVALEHFGGNRVRAGQERGRHYLACRDGDHGPDAAAPVPRH